MFAFYKRGSVFFLPLSIVMDEILDWKLSSGSMIPPPRKMLVIWGHQDSAIATRYHARAQEYRWLSGGLSVTRMEAADRRSRSCDRGGDYNNDRANLVDL
jgi:hypothetical protein